METGLIARPSGILALLALNAGFWFLLEKRTGWKLFQYFPPLIFIYAIPAVFSNTGLIPTRSPLYSWMGETLLPVFLVLLMLDVDIRKTIQVMGRGLLVMLVGTAGVVAGAPIGYWSVRRWLDEEAWKGFGALAGSWIGGTGNMAAVAEGLGTSGTHFGLAVVADNVVYLVWLPLLLQSKQFSGWFHRFTGVQQQYLDRMKQAAEALIVEKSPLQVRHLLYLTGIAFGAAHLSSELAVLLPQFPPVLTTSTYRIVLVTTLGLLFTLTPARRIPGSHVLAMALVYLFVGRMGAVADLQGLAGMAVPFVAGAFVWIFIHGLFIVLAARWLKIDVSTAAISSAANIGGAASAPVVAAFHDERLVPVSILMALIGYAIGNYAAFAAAYLCHQVAIL